ncbi:hypothetical protein C1H46_033177 [Malus baccata]|uniref:Uncharacterized protein n=1 Tax=Malus baccata TaxID=106549 RepID=A0A540L458_MALBA|nr:hypothetical protein C1H46_033177 [Malus baccata]
MHKSYKLTYTSLGKKPIKVLRVGPSFSDRRTKVEETVKTGYPDPEKWINLDHVTQIMPWTYESIQSDLYMVGMTHTIWIGSSKVLSGQLNLIGTGMVDYVWPQE